jgi:mono/diheme cytochrome c family protein
MQAKTIQAFVITAAVFVAGSLAHAANGVGKREYDNNCAACHGLSGKGDGPYAGIIDAKIPDLTMLQKNSNGVFPFDRVYELIDGRAEVRAHGTRDMPIWGNEYNAKAAEYYSDYPDRYNVEGYIRGRILALISYIYSLQAK